MLCIRQVFLFFMMKVTVQLTACYQSFSCYRPIIRHFGLVPPSKHRPIVRSTLGFAKYRENHQLHTPHKPLRPAITLRPYQRDCVDRSLEAMKLGIGRQIISLPVGKQLEHGMMRDGGTLMHNSRWLT
jgi:hypothetical protein